MREREGRRKISDERIKLDITVRARMRWFIDAWISRKLSRIIFIPMGLKQLSKHHVRLNNSLSNVAHDCRRDLWLYPVLHSRCHTPCLPRSVIVGAQDDQKKGSDSSKSPAKPRRISSINAVDIGNHRRRKASAPWNIFPIKWIIRSNDSLTMSAPPGISSCMKALSSLGHTSS